jgi:hypothetical protein
MEDQMFDSPEPGNAWAAIYKLANVPATGPNNRSERRRVEKVLARLKKRGLTVSDVGGLV